MTMLVGDSIGLSLTDDLTEYVNTCVVGRQFSTGLIVVKAFKAQHKLHRKMVIELGTNGPIAKSDMAMMVETLGNRRTVYVNNYLPDLPQYDYLRANNRLIASACDGVQRILVRWKSAAVKHPEWFTSDPMHIHPDSAGQAWLAAKIRQAVDG